MNSDYFVINPLTKRKLVKGGPTHRQLVAKGILPPARAKTSSLVVETPQTPQTKLEEIKGGGVKICEKKIRIEDAQDTPLEKKDQDAAPEEKVSSESGTVTCGASVEECHVVNLPKPTPEELIQYAEEKRHDLSEFDCVSDAEESEEEKELSPDAFFYDNAYKSYREALNQSKVEEYRQKYSHMSTEELKLMMEIMSDQIVYKSLKKA